MDSKNNQLLRAYEVIKQLRDPQSGCPWDNEQTHESLLRYLIEEAYEYLHAVESGDDAKMREELGDVLLQVFLHSVIAQQRGAFTIEEVAKELADKMIRRHPHVFKTEDSNIPVEKIKENWERIKSEERPKQSYALEKDLISFPALYSSYKIGKKTSKLNFDWDNYSQVLYKVEEEWQELKEELAPGDINSEKVKEEMGDFLFSVAQLARHLNLDPEDTLRQANIKFLNRFQKVEDYARKNGKTLKECSQSNLDEYWDLIKIEERNSR